MTKADKELDKLLEEVIAEQTTFLKRYPEFEEQPATIREFMGPHYLNIEGMVRPGLMAALEDIFGTEVNPKRLSKVRRAMFTGAIGIGKTTFASLAIPYMLHWVLCLRNPQKFYNLLPGSRIAFMQMSTTEDQAKEVLFGDIKARIEHSKWFNEKGYVPDSNFKNQLRFPKDLWVLPGNSQETTFEGYNILAGILDEMDSHKITKDKDYADVGYDTIQGRISSRFGNEGLLICIGQMKKGSGFAAKKYKELLGDDEAYVIRMTIWESFGWEKYLNKEGERNSFWYDARRKEIISKFKADMINDRENVIEIPNTYKKNFQNAPEKALKDLAGIPPEAGDPFISLVHKIDEARQRWIDHYDPDGTLGSGPVDDSPSSPQFAEWFRAQDSLRRAIHVDIAYSGEGDALGLAMGHIREVVEADGELKPYIVFDFLMRIKANAGQEIFIGDVRQIIYRLRDELGFKLEKVTYDGFESTDSIQQLNRKRIWSEKVSIDKSLVPYYDLRDALYENRIEFPPYLTYLKRGGTERVEIAVQELSQLEDIEKKIDHPVGGSKDVADAMAGVVFNLMGNRQYRRGVANMQQYREKRFQRTGTDDGISSLISTNLDPTRGLDPLPQMKNYDDLLGGLPIPDHIRRNR